MPMTMAVAMNREPNKRMAGELSRELCRTVAEEVLRQREWHLAYEGMGITARLSDEFVSEVLQEALHKRREARRAQPLERIVKRAVITCYCRRLYEACRAHRTLRQQRAWEELSAYLLIIAQLQMPNDPGQAQECAQQALLNLWRQFRNPQWNMKRPGALLHYAEQTLLREVWRFWEQEKIRGDKEKPLEKQGRKLEEETRADTVERSIPGRPPSDLVGEDHQRVIAAIRACPRSERQRAVIIETFLNDRSVLEIAEQLDTSPENVYVLRSRALKRLRECPELLETLMDVLRD